MKYFLLAACIAVSAVGMAQKKAIYKKQVTSQKDSAIICMFPQMPEPTIDIKSYLSKNIYYPDSARKKGIEGRVAVQFVVNENGTTSDFKVVRGIGFGCDEEALRVLKAMPAWKPGNTNGKPEKVLYTQAISFKLTD